MDDPIHNLEKEAYFSLSQSFVLLKLNQKAMSWEKESLITDLRKELRISEVEHREFLRECRQTGQHQASALLPIQDVGTSSMFPVFQKELRTSHPLPDLSVPSTVINPHSVTTPVQPSSSTGSLERMCKLSSVANTNIPFRYHSTSGGVTPHETTSLGTEVLGQKVYTRWPEENKFSEAVIFRFNPADGRHCFVYNMNTKYETWEWVDMKQIPAENIRWEGEEPGISRQGVDAEWEGGQ